MRSHKEAIYRKHLAQKNINDDKVTDFEKLSKNCKLHTDESRLNGIDCLKHSFEVDQFLSHSCENKNPILKAQLAEKLKNIGDINESILMQNAQIVSVIGVNGRALRRRIIKRHKPNYYLTCQIPMNIITERDVIKINRRLLGEAEQKILSEEDEALFNYITKSVRPFNQSVAFQRLEKV